MGSSRLRQSSLEERYRKCLRISLTFLFSQVGLIGLVVAYSAAGAVLFEWLEADQEIEPRRKILQIRLDCLDHLNRLNRLHHHHQRQQFDNNSDELWAIKAGALLKAFETQVVKATKVEGYDGKEVDDAERQWSVSGSLLYSITVITTIGYGNLAPKTGPGKVVTIIYALIGIPLMLLCLSNLGSFMASSFQFAFGKLYCCFWCSSQKCCCSNSNYRRQRRRQQHQQQLKALLTQPGHVLSSTNPHRHQQVPVEISKKRDEKVATAQSDNDDGMTAEDLAQLAERDYDIVINCCEDGLIRSSSSSRTQQQQQQQQRAVSGGLNYCGSDRLNDKARTLLADCSRYYVESRADQGAAPRPKALSDGWPAAASDAEEPDGGQGQQQRLLMCDSPVPPAPPPPAVQTTDIKSTLGIVPAAAASDAAIESAKVNQHGTNNAADGPVVHKSQPQQQQQQQQQQQRVPVSVVLAFLVGYICIGAAVFSAWEEWSYLDGAYFSFITLSTIGFGDLVPGSKVLEQGETKLVACIVYLVVGLAMIAMSFNLVQEEVIYNFQRLGQNMGILDEK